MAAGDDDQISAKLHRARHGHGASHTQRARRVRTRCDHAAFVWLAAHCKRFSAQSGILRFFHRAEKGIEINVQNRAGHGCNYSPETLKVSKTFRVCSYTGQKCHEIALLIILNILLRKDILETAYSQKELFWIYGRHYLAFD